MISFENVSKYFVREAAGKVRSYPKVPRLALSDISVHIPEGVAVGLIGESGAGKTTFMKIACGLLEASSGAVYVSGRNPVQNRKRLSSDMSVYFTDIPLLQGEDTVLGNFQSMEILYRKNRKEFWEEYRILAGQLGFCEYERMRVQQLSLGQRKRVELGAALICRPKLLLLDEPANGMDEQGKAVLWDILRQRVEEGMTLLFASHNMSEVEHLCERILLLEKGKLLYYGEKDLLMRKYASVNRIQLRFRNTVPDMEDLPLIKYSICSDILTLEYDSRYISSAEIIRNVLKQTVISEMQIIKPGLAEVITRRKEEMEHESFDRGGKREQVFQSKQADSRDSRNGGESGCTQI